MAFLKKVVTEEELNQATKEGGNSKHITKSGIYPVTLLAPVVSTGKNGSIAIDLFVDHAGQEQVIYGGMRIYNNDGSENKIGMGLFLKMCKVCNIDPNDVEDSVDAELPIGKKGAAKDVKALEGFDGSNIQVRIQVEYSKYNDNISENKIIRGFYDEKGASAQELTKGEGHGSQLEKDQAYASDISYRDNLTEEDIKDWIKNNRGQGGGAAAGGSDTVKQPTKKVKFGK